MGVFGDEAARPATASVRLTLRPGASLSRDALNGIRTFVAGAVSGLEPHRVALLDDRGAPLSENGGTDQADALRGSLQSALDAAFGAGATIVRVRVSYDERSHDVHDARREPLGAHAIAAARTDEHYTNDRKRYAKTTASEDRGSALHDERSSVSPGATERISLAVLVDAARRLDAAKIREISATTVGIEPQRGDAVSVQVVTFVTARRTVPSLRAEALGYAASVAPMLAIATVMLVALRLTARPVIDLIATSATRANARALSASVRGAPSGAVLRALAGEPPHAVAAVLRDLPSTVVAEVLESYAPGERAAIVQSMAAPMAPIAREARSALSFN
jgi:flagellar M-ring protein FliF